MWAIRLPDGDFLDLPRNFSLQFELNNQIFSSSDSSVLPGSYSFPVDIPLSVSNRRLLQHPQLVNNARKWQDIEDVWVYAYGKPMFNGYLRINSATETSVRCTLVSNPLRDLKDLQLNNLDTGGERTLGANAAAVLAHALDTANNPLDYDYIFFPLYNFGFLSNFTSDKQKWINWYDADGGGVFAPDDDAPGFIPFVRLEYIINKIFEGLDYTLRNNWLITNELRQIVLYNHYSLYTGGALSLTADLRNHLPKTTSTDLLKKLVGNFCLGIFVNPFSREIRITPLRDIIKRAAKHDWSQYAIYGLTIEDDSRTTPEIFRFDAPSEDEAIEFYTQYPRPADSEVLGTVLNLPLLDAASVDGYYYVLSEHAYWLRQSGIGATKIFRWGTFLPAPTETGSPEFVSDLVPLLDSHVPFIHGQATADSWMLRAPSIKQLGTITYTYNDGVDDITVEQVHDNPLRLTVYRGFSTGSPYSGYSTRSVPYASASPYGPGGNGFGQYSLRWEGQFGLYEKWWKDWHQVLTNGKHVKQFFALPISALIDFSFEDKVRVGSMEYLLKQIRVQKLIGNGQALVEVSMVSVI